MRVLGQRFVTFLAIRVIIRLAATPSTTARARASAKTRARIACNRTMGSPRAVDAACAMLERAMGEIRASVRRADAWRHDDGARVDARAREAVDWNDVMPCVGAFWGDAKANGAREPRVECELESVDVGEFGDDASEASEASRARRRYSVHARDDGVSDRGYANIQAVPMSMESPSCARREIQRLKARCARLEREAAARVGGVQCREQTQGMTSSNVDAVAQDVLVNEIVNLRQHVTRVNAERDRLIEMSNDLRAALHARTRSRAARAVNVMRDAGETSAASDAEDAICTLWDHNQHLVRELRRAQAVIRGRDRLIERERNREPTTASVIPVVEATPAIRTNACTSTMAPESSRRETASQKLKLQNAIRRAKARRGAMTATPPKVRNWNERDQRQ